VIIVTGSASGIGLVTSTIALTEGARVLGVDISPAPNSILENASFKFVQCDLCHESAPDQIIEACTEAFGRRVDGLLNIAGVMDLNQSVDTVSDAMWERCIAINLTAPMKLMRAVIPIMREQRSGSIVNVCSKAAMSGAVSGVAYTASEHHPYFSLQDMLHRRGANSNEIP
jgi:NAD(P)-dependent dehydrogenase (short-subunit alcohol dehydrogenase family)